MARLGLGSTSALTPVSRCATGLRQRGLAVLEATLVIGVAASVATGGLLYAQQAAYKAKFTDIISSVTTIKRIAEGKPNLAGPLPYGNINDQFFGLPGTQLQPDDTLTHPWARNGLTVEHLGRNVVRYALHGVTSEICHAFLFRMREIADYDGYAGYLLANNEVLVGQDNETFTTFLENCNKFQATNTVGFVFAHRVQDIVAVSNMEPVGWEPFVPPPPPGGTGGSNPDPTSPTEPIIVADGGTPPSTTPPGTGPITGGGVGGEEESGTDPTPTDPTPETPVEPETPVDPEAPAEPETPEDPAGPATPPEIPTTTDPTEPTTGTPTTGTPTTGTPTTGTPTTGGPSTTSPTSPSLDNPDGFADGPSRNETTTYGHAKTVVTLLLDASGSMEAVRAATVSALNSWISVLKGSAEDILFSLYYFTTNSGGRGALDISQVYDNAKIASVGPVTVQQYDPYGATPLYDAALHVMRETEQLMRKQAAGTRTVFAIQTDGLENTSVASAERVSRAVDAHQAAGWEFTFMGASGEAAAQAGQMGIESQYVLTYGPDQQSISQAFSQSAQNAANYAAGRVADTAFNQFQRQVAGEDKATNPWPYGGMDGDWLAGCGPNEIALDDDSDCGHGNSPGGYDPDNPGNSTGTNANAGK